MPRLTEKEEYTRWLLNYIGADRCNYIFLSNTLNNIEFYWSISDDKNRAVDAKELRNLYIDECGEDILNDITVNPTVLEVLCALSLRADVIIGEGPYSWFVIFLENLGFDFLTDDKWSYDGKSFVISTIRKWLDRRFSHNGSGSPFRSAKHDLTKTSIWNSLQWYLADEFGEDHI